MADVLTSERQYFAAKRELANAQFDDIVDVTHLKEQTGQLNPQDLLEINLWLATRNPTGCLEQMPIKVSY
jgi:outer membrane protein